MTERKPFIAPFWVMVISLSMAVAFLFVLAIAGGIPKSYAEDRCAGIGVIASAVRVQGFDVAVETDAAKVEEVLNLLKANGFPEHVTAEGLFFVKTPEGIRVSFISAGCLTGMVHVDAAAGEAIRRIVKFEVSGRDT